MSDIVRAATDLRDAAARIIHPTAFDLRDELVRTTAGRGPTAAPEPWQDAMVLADSQCALAYAKASAIFSLVADHCEALGQPHARPAHAGDGHARLKAALRALDAMTTPGEACPTPSTALSAAHASF